ncbi:transport and Golgi organization protein 1 isoform X1 [Frieseomelitta varia]|uniref:transport and Golgi organization protein 1 isoform X1 n=1 Tax=Frieseomelitta varia TaxID=561572 RepID=UPI001CB6AC89|nr:transport and Golgi organization protein 1 isoform X1 [Frieseomelitta varia]
MWNCSSRNMTENLFSVLFLVIAIIFSVISQCSSVLSDKRLCYDPKCSEPISLARTTIKYSPNEAGLLAFKINDKVTVYSKEAGRRKDLWGVEINGNHGYIPKSFVKEYKIFHRDLKYEVSIDSLFNNISSNEKLQSKKSDIENKSGIKVSNEQTDNLDLKSSKELPESGSDITSSYEIIDGTTVHLDHNGPFEPTFVKENVQATVVSNGQNGVEMLNSKLETKEQATSNEADFQDFVKSSENILDLPQISGIHSSPLNISILSDKVEYPTKDVDNKTLTNVEDNQFSDKIIDINNLQISTINGSKEESNIEKKKVTELNKEDVSSSKEVVNNAPDVRSMGVTEQTKSVDIQSLENATSETQPHIQSVESSNEIKTDIFSSASIELITFNDTKSGKENVGNSDQIETKDIQSPQNVTIIATSDIKLNEQHIEHSDKVEMKDDHSSVIIATNDTKSNEKNVDSFDEIETKDIQSAQNVTVIATSDTKLNEQHIEHSDKVEMKDGRSSVIIATNDTNSDERSADSSDHIKTKDIQSPQNVTVIATSDTKLNEQHIEHFDKVEMKDGHSSVIITTNDTKSDERSADSSDQIETKDIQSPQNVTIIAINDIKSDEQSAENSEVETDVHSSVNIAIIAINDTKSDEDNVGSSDQIEIKDIQSSQNVTITTTTDTTTNAKSNNAENSDKIDIESVSLLENIKTRIKNLELQTEEHLELQVEPDDSRKVKETESIENFSKHDIEEDVNNKVSVVTDTNNIEEKITSSIQYILDTEDTMAYITKETSENIFYRTEPSLSNVCTIDNVECSLNDIDNDFPHHEQVSQSSENAPISGIEIENYWLTLMYLSVTAIAILIFSLGYYCIENMRGDRQLIARINKLEKDLLISEAECTMVNENLKSTKEKLSRMEDESFGSDEMVLSLRADLEASQNAKAELEDQVAMLEKDLESATEAGLELEKMLREVLSSNNEVNPLAQSVEDLQSRLNAQQAANESLTNALNLKTQENESVSAELTFIKRKYEEFEIEFTKLRENLKLEVNSKNNIERTLNDKVQQLEMQIKEISTEKASLQKELKGKEVEVKDLVDAINRLNSNNLDLDKLYDVSHIKVEATALLEERNELKIRLAETEGAHNLLEEHVKVIKEEIATLSEQCKIAEKEKKDAETRLEVLTNFFEEKEAQRQKEEAIWLQQQGEVVSTVERIQTMQNEIQNYKQQVEMLKREILDQEREYKNQISVLETKAHEQWVIARQVERRLEESKVEAGQLRNRLTLIEKNINDVDSEAKLHRLEANGETTTSPPLFIGAESSSSPIIFSGSSNVPPPPPPSYLHSLFPHYLPPPLPNTSGVPPYEVGQRPPPLGGRLSSPPPMSLHPPAPNRYDNTGSPPPMSPHLLPPFNHRSPPPPFSNDIHPPPPPPGSILPPPLGTPHVWGEETLPPPRNSGFHQARERVRNHKGSLHSSGESLDKSHHNSKV